MEETKYGGSVGLRIKARGSLTVRNWSKSNDLIWNARCALWSAGRDYEEEATYRKFFESKQKENKQRNKVMVKKV